MKRLSLLMVLLTAACTGPRQAKFPQPQILPPPSSHPEVKNPNFETIVIEAVPNADEEGVSFTMIFVDGKQAGQTEVGPRSQEKHVRLKLPAGNLPIRLEHWFLPPVGEWTLLPDAQQPRERFVRIEEGSITRLTLRYDPAGRPTLSLSRESVPR